MPHRPHRYPVRIPLSVPHMCGNEMKYVEEAFKTNWVSTMGSNLDALEQRFEQLCGFPAVALSSGTAGIHLGLKLLGIRPKDEVVCPTLTFVASANPILYESGVPVFIDSERASWNLDPSLLAQFLERRARVNRLPRAVIVVHLFGQGAALDPILESCRRYDVPMLEDAAEALGGSYKGRALGSFGDVGVFSLNGNKVITSSGGGVLISPHSGWVEKARFWSTQACDAGRDYLHSEIGYNYRLSNVLAGIALGQMDCLVERVERRRQIAQRYKQGLAAVPGVSFMPDPPDCFNTCWLSCILIDPRLFRRSQSQLLQFLDDSNVSARPIWRPMHLQKLYNGYEYIGGTIAEDLNKFGICLPSSSSLTAEEQDFIIARIREVHLNA